MAVKSYITAQDLVDSLSESTYMELLDDDNAGTRAAVDASAPVQSVLAESMVLVSSRLPDIYSKLPPETGAAGVVSGGDGIPVLLKFAQLQYARILSYRRHREYVRTYSAEPGGSAEKQADMLMERIQAGIMRITPNDNPPEPTPRNVGGSTAADGPRIAMSGTDGSSNSGDW